MPADRAETRAVTVRTAVLADLLLAMVITSQQSASAAASSQPRSGPRPALGRERRAQAQREVTGGRGAQRQRGSLIGWPARHEQPPCEPARGEHADRPDPEPDGRHGARHPRGVGPGEEGQRAGRSLVRHCRPLACHPPPYSAELKWCGSRSLGPCADGRLMNQDLAGCRAVRRR